MAQYAYNYNGVYDDYIVQAAPKEAPRPAEKRPSQPPLQRMDRSKEQEEKAKRKKFKITLAKISLVAAAFIAVILVAVTSFQQLNAAKKELEDVNAAYQLSLSESNELKQRIDELVSEKDIDDYAQNELNLVKIPKTKMRIVDVTPFQ